MKHVTASEARRNWFRLLDEAANGEVIAIERNDKRLLLTLERKQTSRQSRKPLIRGRDLDNADKWGWDWTAKGTLMPRKKK
jgi:hypothetical protein